MMRARVVDPVVEIFHNSCSACSQHNYCARYNKSTTRCFGAVSKLLSSFICTRNYGKTYRPGIMVIKQLDVFNASSSQVSSKKKQSSGHYLLMEHLAIIRALLELVFILKKMEFLFIKDGYFLGIKTNNQAEYFALLLGLFMMQEYVQKEDTVHIISDSQLLSTSA